MLTKKLDFPAGFPHIVVSNNSQGWFPNMLRIGLFLATNIAIMALIAIIFQVLGLESTLAQNGVDLNL